MTRAAYWSRTVTAAAIPNASPRRYPKRSTKHAPASAPWTRDERRTNDLAHMVRTLRPILREPRSHLQGANMSWQAVSYAVTVLEHDDNLTLLDRLVLVLLAEHANRDGSNARPSSRTIATRAGTTDVSVRRSLARLVAAGIIAPDRRPGRPTCYRFPLSTPVSAVIHPTEGDLYPQSANLYPQGYMPVSAGIHEPVMNRSINQRDHVTADTCAWCDGTGWEYEDDNHVRRCRSRCSA